MEWEISMDDGDPYEVVEQAKSNLTPLQFLQAVYCNESLPLQARLKAAIEAAQYVHPRLAVTGIIEGQNIAALLEARLARIKKGEIGINKPAMIEAKLAATESG